MLGRSSQRSYSRLDYGTECLRCGVVFALTNTLTRCYPLRERSGCYPNRAINGAVQYTLSLSSLSSPAYAKYCKLPSRRCSS